VAGLPAAAAIPAPRGEDAVAMHVPGLLPTLPR